MPSPSGIFFIFILSLAAADLDGNCNNPNNWYESTYANYQGDPFYSLFNDMCKYTANALSPGTGNCCYYVDPYGIGIDNGKWYSWPKLQLGTPTSSYKQTGATAFTPTSLAIGSQCVEFGIKHEVVCELQLTESTTSSTAVENSFSQTTEISLSTSLSVTESIGFAGSTETLTVGLTASVQSGQSTTTTSSSTTTSTSSITVTVPSGQCAAVFTQVYTATTTGVFTAVYPVNNGAVIFNLWDDKSNNPPGAPYAYSGFGGSAGSAFGGSPYYWWNLLHTKYGYNWLNGLTSIQPNSITIQYPVTSTYQFYKTAVCPCNTGCPPTTFAKIG